jgi:hypothetical protein
LILSPGRRGQAQGERKEVKEEELHVAWWGVKEKDATVAMSVRGEG